MDEKRLQLGHKNTAHSKIHAKLIAWEMQRVAIQPFGMPPDPKWPNSLWFHLNLRLADGCPPHLIWHAESLLLHMLIAGKYREAMM